jgi:cytochrome c551/c552
MSWYHRIGLFVVIGMLTIISIPALTDLATAQARSSISDQLLQAPPSQPLNHYDYFGQLLSPQQAAELVRKKNLNPNEPTSYQKIGAVHITPSLIEQGEQLFFKRPIGNFFTGAIFGDIIGDLAPEFQQAIADLGGKQTTNLQLKLQKDVKLGSKTFKQGTTINTGYDVEKGGRVLGGRLSCASCHATLSAKGDRLKGVPNGDFNIPFILAVAPNSASGFARLNLNPLDPKYQGNGRTIINSQNKLVKLPDPQKFEDAFDDALLQIPVGNFESSPDGISNTTQIPSMFTFKTGPYTADGQFAVGPFAGLSAFTNAVHSSEIDLPSAAQLSAETLNIDREVYLGTILQNAADSRLQLPPNQTVKPSEWLRQIVADPANAELADQIPAPGAGTYPNLRPSLVSYNGLIFSPNTDKSGDIASGKFFAAVNAMAAWQNSLQPPANQSPENQLALQNGSVQRGAIVFQNANCASCHKAPFFTDNIIHPLSKIKTNPARAKSRLALNKLLVAPKLYPFDTPIPIPANTKMIDVPTVGITKNPTTLPTGILPNGGYKTTSLLGLYASAPYLHDGGVAVRKDSLKVNLDGSFTIVNTNGLGLPGTLRQSLPADSSNSLRALIDRQLRAKVVAANKANPELVTNNLDGTGHDFYVDKSTGFTATQQHDLINFLLSLDNNPGKF